MRRTGIAVLLGCACAYACAPRHGAANGPASPLRPPAPPPPGSVVVWGPLEVEAVDAVHHEVGWTRDFVRGSRVVGYDVTLVQPRATCAADAPLPSTIDTEGCRGVVTFPASCRPDPILRGRARVVVVYAIDVAARCAGDATPFALPATGDVRAALASAGISCFQARNKFRPEATWTSLYALTELDLREHVTEVRTAYPALVARALAGGAGISDGGAAATAAMSAGAWGEKGARGGRAGPLFCRDDGAYLDGFAGRPARAALADAAASPALATALASAAAGGAEDTAKVIPLTEGAWRSEHALWELCQSTDAAANVVVSGRCQLLRQLDRFIRDVDDVARPETPKGGPGAPSAPTSSVSPSTPGGPR